MTSPRKVKDFTKISLQRKKPAPSGRRSKFAKEIEQILELAPPEGLLFPVPTGRAPERYRRSLRQAVSRLVEPVSPHRYRVSIAVNGQILVGCFA